METTGGFSCWRASNGENVYIWWRHCVLGPAIIRDLAPGKPTWQSSSGGGHAFRAVDGNRDPRYERGSCTLTDTTETPIWAVDLGVFSKVAFVEVVNRDTHGQRPGYIIGYPSETHHKSNLVRPEHTFRLSNCFCQFALSTPLVMPCSQQHCEIISQLSNEFSSDEFGDFCIIRVLDGAENE